MLIARRNLTQEKTRLALSIGGVALAIMLVLILDGLLVGMFRQITAYLDHRIQISPARRTSRDSYWIGVASMGNRQPHSTQ